MGYLIRFELGGVCLGTSHSVRFLPPTSTHSAYDSHNVGDKYQGGNKIHLDSIERTGFLGDGWTYMRINKLKDRSQGQEKSQW